MYSQGTSVEGEDVHDSPIPGTSSSSQPSKRVKVDEDNYYCKLCLEGEHKKFASKGLPGRIQNVKKYSVKTATTCMADHVKSEHNIDPSQLSQDGKRQKLLFTTTGSEASCYSGAAGTNAQFEFSRRITLWFARDLVSFEEINKDGFQDFLAYYLPKLSVPSSTTLRTGALLDVYFTLKGKVKDMLSPVDCISIMFDGWTDRYAANGYLGLRLACIDPKWKYHVVTISVKPLSQHTSLEISNHVLEELKDFGIDLQKVTVYSTHDGARNMVKCSKLMEVSGYHHCMAHTLHLLLTVDSLYQVKDVKDVLEKCKQIVTSLHFKGYILADELLKSQEKVCLAKFVKEIEKVAEALEVEDAISEGIPVSGFILLNLYCNCIV